MPFRLFAVGWFCVWDVYRSCQLVVSCFAVRCMRHVGIMLHRFTPGVGVLMPCPAVAHHACGLCDCSDLFAFQCRWCRFVVPHPKFCWLVAWSVIQSCTVRSGHTAVLVVYQRCSRGVVLVSQYTTVYAPLVNGWKEARLDTYGSSYRQRTKNGVRSRGSRLVQSTVLRQHGVRATTVGVRMRPKGARGLLLPLLDGAGACGSRGAMHAPG